MSSATDNTVATATSGATVWQKLTHNHLTTTGNPFGGQLLHVQDEKTSGTSGGTSSTSFVKRTLNTVKTNEISGASLASDVITLPAGTYRVWARAPSQAAFQHQTRLRNTTDSTTLIVGSNAVSDNTNNIQSDSTLVGSFTIAGTKNIEFQHKHGLATGSGLGDAISSGEVEVYAQVMIWKIA